MSFPTILLAHDNVYLSQLNVIQGDVMGRHLSCLHPTVDAGTVRKTFGI